MFSMHLLKYAGANEVNSDINNYLHNYDSDNDDCMLISIKGLLYIKSYTELLYCLIYISQQTCEEDTYIITFYRKGDYCLKRFFKICFITPVVYIYKIHKLKEKKTSFYEQLPTSLTHNLQGLQSFVVKHRVTSSNQVH